MKIIIADNVRRLDDKYDSFLEFGLKMRYTTDYSDIDYLRSFDYDRYKDMLNKVDYDTYTLVKVKK